MEKYKVLGVCAGNGVCLLPFHPKYGLQNGKTEIIGNIEPRSVFYDKKNLQWKLNFKDIPQDRKINRIYNPDIIIGHPDCGHASVLRLSRAKTNISAKDNESLNLFIHSIGVFNPKLFMMENLPGLLKTYSQDDFRDMWKDYNLKFHISSVANYGNSQVSRERLVIVGIRKDLNTKGFFKLPELNDWVEPSQNFEYGAEEIVEVGHVREPLDKTCNLYYKDKRQITYRLAQSLWNYEFKHTSKWPVGGKMKNQPGVSKNMFDKPPFTVRKQNRQFGTTGLVLSPREMAQIQGVPPTFKIKIDMVDRIYWLNKWRLTVTKTMPVEIAEWFATKAIKTLDKLDKDSK